MTGKHYLLASLFLVINPVLAQSLPNPEIVGVRLGMSKAAALSQIKSKYPNALVSPLKKSVATEVGELIYEAQYLIDLGASKTAADDKVMLTFLPDDKVLAVKRTIRYQPSKQKTADLYMALTQKFGNPVYFVSDDSTRFEDQAMWSDKMLPGLSLIGSAYVQGGRISSTDFGTVTPYPYCEMEMSAYTSQTFSPKALFTALTDKSDFTRNKVNKAKACGTALWVHNTHERPQIYNTVQTEMYLMNLEEAPAKVLQLGEMVANHPKTIRFSTVSQPKMQGSTPDL